MKTILVTGSNGLLGQKITERMLRDKQFNLIATSKGANRFPVKEGYTYAEMDILDPENVRSCRELSAGCDHSYRGNDQCRYLRIRKGTGLPVECGSG